MNNRHVRMANHTSGLALLYSTLLSIAGCSADVSAAPSPTAPLVSEEDRQLLDEMKRKKQARADLETQPWRFVVSGEGNVQTFDKGIINTYSEVRGYPVHNTTEFDIVALEAEATMLRDDGSVLATVPVTFEGGLLAREDKMLKATSPTVQGKATKFSLRVTKVRLHSE